MQTPQPLTPFPPTPPLASVGDTRARYALTPPSSCQRPCPLRAALASKRETSVLICAICGPANSLLTTVGTTTYTNPTHPGLPPFLVPPSMRE